MHLFCDFDGTISRVDTTDHVLARLGDPHWRDLEAELDAVELDPGFLDFVAWAGEHALSLTIVSDGVDYFIRRILRRHGLDGLPVVSNRLVGTAGARRLEQPFRRTGCAGGSGVCKCEALRSRESPARLTVFVGDGRSDFCASSRADMLFAKGSLADFAASRSRPFYPFETFHDVTAQLASRLAARRAVS
jgi:2-hydroxy-3-keto-5-methylthiopentenyl-1-phosphate phosphatase